MSFVFIGMKSMLYYGGRNSWFSITTSADYFVLRCEGLCFSRFLDISRGWPSISRCSHRHRWLLARYSQVLGMRQKAEQFSKVFTKSAHILKLVASLSCQGKLCSSGYPRGEMFLSTTGDANVRRIIFSMPLY